MYISYRHASYPRGTRVSRRRRAPAPRPPRGPYNKGRCRSGRAARWGRSEHGAHGRTALGGARTSSTRRTRDDTHAAPHVERVSSVNRPHRTAHPRAETADTSRSGVRALTTHLGAGRGRTQLRPGQTSPHDTNHRCGCHCTQLRVLGPAKTSTTTPITTSGCTSSQDSALTTVVLGASFTESERPSSQAPPGHHRGARYC